MATVFATALILAPSLHSHPASQLLVNSVSTLFTEATPGRTSPPIGIPGVGHTLNLASVPNGGTFIYGMTYSPQPGWFSGLTGRPSPRALSSSFFSCGFCATPECAMSDRAIMDRCWSFAGFPGELAIALASPAYLTHVAIEHVPAESRLSSAPRDVVIWGLIEGEDNQRKILQSNDLMPKLLSHFPHRPGKTIPYPSVSSNVHHFLPIATFQYSIRSSNLYEVFDIFQEIQDLEIDFGIIVLQINSNWGYPETHLHHLGIFGRTLISM